MKQLLLSISLSLPLLTACSKDAKPAAPPPSASAQPPWPSAVFEGPPAGGRGGAYRYTLCEDKTFTRWCLDADCDRGTWRFETGTIVLTSSSPDHPGEETRLPVSADGKTLGGADTEGGPLTHRGPATCS